MARGEVVRIPVSAAAAPASAAPPHLTGAQLRAARALLRWTRAELASAAHVSLPTLHRLEGCDGYSPGQRWDTALCIRRALERAGVRFPAGGAALTNQEPAA